MPWICLVTLILKFVFSIKGIKVNFFTNELWGTQMKMKKLTGKYTCRQCAFTLLYNIISKSGTNESQDLNVKNVFSELLSINVYTPG